VIHVRRSGERGHFNHGWLDTYHTFSFADYYDPMYMGFRALRVINEDRVAPGEGFPTHPHRDMEIITYVLEGALEHRDSMGNGSVIHSGDVQRMTAGTGITHSEYNPSSEEPVHLLQIWLQPDKRGYTPGYEQTILDGRMGKSGLHLIASNQGGEGVVKVNQDVQLFAGFLGPKESLEYRLPRGRHAWLQIVRGVVSLGSEELRSGDAAGIADEHVLELKAANGGAEFLLFDLA